MAERGEGGGGPHSPALPSKKLAQQKKGKKKGEEGRGFQGEGRKKGGRCRYGLTRAAIFISCFRLVPTLRQEKEKGRKIDLGKRKKKKGGQRSAPVPPSAALRSFH